MLYSLLAVILNILVIDHVYGGAIIGNGKVTIGVVNHGNLNEDWVAGINLPGYGITPATDPLGIHEIGLRNNELTYASTEPGCLCEGWGVGVNYGAGIVQQGGADRAYLSTAAQRNIVVESFTGTHGGSTATSVTRERSVGSYRVTHDFSPSASPYAMQVDVTIENLSGSPFTDVQYLRNMDWDIYPTPFAEYVTIQGTASTSLIRSHDNAFCIPFPLTTCNPRTAGTLNVDFEDVGPSDHGASFLFSFGALAAGDSVSFRIFYGATDNEDDAETALGVVGAEAFSLGQQRDDPGTGTPQTFFFGFTGVGGDPVFLSHANVLYSLDQSRSITVNGYTGFRDTYINAYIDDTESYDSIAIQVYSDVETGVATVYSFGSDAAAAKAALAAQPYQSGSTDVLDALTSAIAEFVANAPDITTRTNCIVLINDGMPKDDPCGAGNAAALTAIQSSLTANGIRLIVVGVEIPPAILADWTAELSCLTDASNFYLIGAYSP